MTRPATPEGDAVSQRILLAEDEALLAMSLADDLEAAGFEVEVAAEGVQALEAAERMLDGRGRGPDALVTDLRMPRMGGEELIRVLRGLWPDLPVVVVTGNRPAGGAAALAREAGGHGPLVVLDKPLGMARLIAELRATLSGEVRGATADP